MKTYLYILITGLSILFACRKSDSPLYSEEARKEIDSILQKNCNTDSLLIFLDSFTLLLSFAFLTNGSGLVRSHILIPFK